MDISTVISAAEKISSAHVLAAWAALKVIVAAWRAKASKYAADFDAEVKKTVAKLKGEVPVVEKDVKSVASFFWTELKKML